MKYATMEDVAVAVGQIIKETVEKSRGGNLDMKFTREIKNRYSDALAKVPGEGAWRMATRTMIKSAIASPKDANVLGTLVGFHVSNLVLSVLHACSTLGEDPQKYVEAMIYRSDRNAEKLGELRDRYREKFPKKSNEAMPVGDFMAAFDHLIKHSGPQPEDMLNHFVDGTGPYAKREKHLPTGGVNKLDALRAELDKLTADVTLLTAEKAAAITADNFDKAKELTTTIKAKEAELT
ncbi:hypothetical protein KW791_02465, partial [Candidatus Parcubacteria bacterium]|nr:hypothetical protein [Candidatus Parcubacteria bacterium]